MRPRRCIVVVLVALLAGTAGGISVAAGAVPGQPPDGVSGHTGTVPGQGVSPAIETEIVQPDPSVLLYVNLTPDGDARWSVVSRFHLENDTDVAAFRAFVADLRNGTAPAAGVGYSPETFRTFADAVEADLSRPASMQIKNATWEGTVHNETGRLSLSFVWTDFARTDGSRVVLGDVFESGDGWFSRIEDDQRLYLKAPAGYAVIQNTLPYRIRENGIIRVDGPVNLSAVNVSVVYEQTASPPTTPTPTPEPKSGTSPVMVGGGLLVLALVVVLGAYAVFRRDVDDEAGAASGTGDGRAPNADADGGQVADASEEPEPGETPADPPPESTPGEAEESESEPDGDETEAAEDTIDEELLSDEERVERLLEQNGGRMKQANIVTETGWSNAKVSQLLSTMDDEDRIDKLRIGRENLITLPDEDVGEIE